LPRTATVLNSNIQYIFCSCIKSIDGHLQIQYIINRDLKSHFQKQTVFYTACFFFFQPEKDAFMRLFCLGFAHIVDGNSWQNATLTKEKLRATITTSQCRDNERRF
ncbi:MAG: hypothetical protein IKZ17_06860, partial [Bacteroidaceae bacterium]|nr:hypothetical protein [Bacteroidaceae bacterium]